MIRVNFFVIVLAIFSISFGVELSRATPTSLDFVFAEDGKLGFRYSLSNSTSSSFDDFSAVTSDTSSRLVVDGSYKNFSFSVHEQLNVRLKQDTGLLIPTFSPVANDRMSLFNGYYEASCGGDCQFFSRLDRLNVVYSTDKVKLQAGRIALSWGHGMVFNVLDFFAPQVPGVYSASYKEGIDAIAGTFALGNHVSISLVNEYKRNYLTERIDPDFYTQAAQIFFAFDGFDFSLVAAKYLNDEVFGGGFAFDFFGSVITYDMVFWNPTSWEGFEKNHSMVVGFQRDVAINKFNIANMQIFAEYFYNSVGLEGGHVSSDNINSVNPFLLKKIFYGDLYLTGRSYFALSTSFEVGQYTFVSGGMIINAQDGSMYNFFGISHSFSEHISFTLSGIIPVGSKGDEFAGGLNPQTMEYIKAPAMIFVGVSIE